MKIFIGLTEVSGYYSGLKKGFDELGVKAEFVSLHTHPFNYGEIKGQSLIPMLARYCVTKRVSLPPHSLSRAFWLLMVLATRIILFIWAVSKFDVFILGGGSSFFRFLDLRILKFFNRKIMYVFHGTDSRPAYIDGFFEGIESSNNKISELALSTYLKSTQRRKYEVSIIEKYADYIISHPGYAQYLKRPFVSFLSIGVPRIGMSNASLPTEIKSHITILHSPSQMAGKGTKQIREAISRLQEKGYKIKYVEIAGRPNSEVLVHLQQCDFVVDQVYSDTPMAGFVAEAAFYGKPAVVGGYYSAKIKNDIPSKYVPPSLFCRPESIEQAIEKLCTDLNYRQKLGLEAKEFVESNWSAKVVASRFIQLINGEAPEDWLINPINIDYLLGCGLQENTIRLIIKSLLESYGNKALQLSDKPDLEKMFVEFAYSSDSSC